ncbi:hypothetical protein BATDEDRAFT_89958 [Batrachochytrium dendrobatidis JAM81]|uniref:Uncharacterized protein n=1 Tax=Batrachochytrium dendrobatidis (strain JAM81 / FGSC 10211) TaxID=684364 RepID=F4P6H4_BATDJ|nr:uncharacterized protein BATDEDRAFT_89958 [Batrachochytrium dendrobatidis JAM81]EGF79349.1 hypothetical protein BATDEDRAFT_89958 [Batrachochytrium dendrobatidis JAM81]|eukprot:XP_006680112.1 hypothetical protein BATDEDRAFT_89958 [Batrachochytrium dendrobatidis JAM81]
MLVSTGSNGSFEASGLIAGFSPRIYKRGRETPFDKDQSDNNGSNQGTTSSKKNQLIRRLERELHEADIAEEVAADAFHRYENLKHRQEMLALKGKAISGEKHSEQRQQELKKEWGAALEKFVLLREKLQTESATPSRDRKHSIDDPGSSTSGRGRKHSVIEPNPCTTKQSRKLPSDKEQPRENRELIRQLVKELEAADAAETAACEASYAYRVIEYEQKRLISQGKPIIGKKHSGIHQCRLDNQWQTTGKKVERLEQQLQEARLATPSRDRKHSIDDPGSSTSGRGRKHSVIEPNPCTTKQSRKLPSDKEQPRENRELIRQLVKELEAADAAETAACEASYAYRVIEYEQKRLISQGKPIIGKKHSGIHQCRLDNQWQTTGKKVEHLEQQLQEARLATPKQSRKHSIDDPGSSTSGRGRKHSIVRHHSDTDSDQGIAPAKKHRPTHQLDINLENAERARVAACNSYYEYKATRLEQKKLKSNGQKISGKKYSSRTEHELKEKCRKASKAKHYMIRQLEGTNGNTPSRSRKHSVVRHHSDTDSDQETLSRKKYRKLVRKLKRRIKEYRRRQKDVCKEYREHQFFVSKQQSRLTRGKSVSKSFYDLEDLEKLERKCKRAGRRVEYLEQKLRKLMGESDSDSD